MRKLSSRQTQLKIGKLARAIKKSDWSQTVRITGDLHEKRGLSFGEIEKWLSECFS